MSKLPRAKVPKYSYSTQLRNPYQSWLRACYRPPSHTHFSGSCHFLFCHFDQSFTTYVSLIAFFASCSSLCLKLLLSTFPLYDSALLLPLFITPTVFIVLFHFLCKVLLYASLIYTWECSYGLVSKIDCVLNFLISSTMGWGSWYFTAYRPRSACSLNASTNIFLKSLTIVYTIPRSSSTHACCHMSFVKSATISPYCLCTLIIGVLF